jgi:hypothetical protein
MGQLQNQKVFSEVAVGGRVHESSLGCSATFP